MIFFGEAMTGKRGNKIVYDKPPHGGVIWFDVFSVIDDKFITGSKKYDILKDFAIVTATAHVFPEYIGPWPDDNIVKELEQRPQALPQPQPTGSFRDQLKKYR